MAARRASGGPGAPHHAWARQAGPRTRQALVPPHGVVVEWAPWVIPGTFLPLFDQKLRIKNFWNFSRKFIFIGCSEFDK